MNVAPRLEGVNQAYGAHMIVDEATAHRAADAVETREVEAILVVGKTEPLRAFEVLGRAGELDAARSALRERFIAGLAAYRAQAWPEAAAEFKASLAAVHDDGPAHVFLERVGHLSEHPPGPGWNGVWALTEK